MTTDGDSSYFISYFHPGHSEASQLHGPGVRADGSQPRYSQHTLAARRGDQVPRRNI